MKPTPEDIEGPFYLMGAPFRSQTTEHPTLTVKGFVYDTDGNEVKNAAVDYWHANEKGEYCLNGYDFRGKVLADGGYEFKTIVPGEYEIGDDEFRCPHIHVKVGAPGYKLLTTQLYFPDNKYNATDQWFDTRRVIETPNGVFDFVLEKDEGYRQP